MSYTLISDIVENMESSQESSLHQQLEQMELLLETIQEYCDENGQIIAKKVKSLFQSTINRVLTNEQIQNIFHAEVDDESIGVIGTISEHHIIEIYNIKFIKNSNYFLNYKMQNSHFDPILFKLAASALTI